MSSAPESPSTSHTHSVLFNHPTESNLSPPYKDEISVMQERLQQNLPLSEAESSQFFLIAEALILEKKYDVAEKFLIPVFNSHPSIVSGLRLAQTSLQLGKAQDAQNTLTKLSVFFPKSPIPLMALAQILQAQQEQKEATRILARGYHNFPKNEEVILKYIESLKLIGQNQKAKTILLESFHKNPNSPQLLMELARTKTEEHKYKEAKNYLENLFRISEQFIEAWVLAGFIAEHENNLTQSEKYYRFVYNKQPNNESIARALVNQLLKQNKFLEARRILSRLEDQDRTSGSNKLDEYSFIIGQCEEKLGNLKEAKKYYKNINKNSSNYEKAITYLLFISIEEGNKEDAVEYLKEYRSFNLQSEVWYRILAQGYESVQNYESATEIAEQGIKTYPKSVELKYAKASYLFRSTRSKAEFIKNMKTIVKDYPKYAPALNDLGFMLVEDGIEKQLAIKLLKKAIELEKTNGTYLDSLGWAYFKNNDTPNALHYLLKAKQFETNEPIIFEHIAEVYYSSKSLNEALTHFETALKMLQSKPKWKLDASPDWQASLERVQKRISDIKERSIIKSTAPYAQ